MCKDKSALILEQCRYIDDIMRCTNLSTDVTQGLGIKEMRSSSLV